MHTTGGLTPGRNSWPAPPPDRDSTRHGRVHKMPLKAAKNPSSPAPSGTNLHSLHCAYLSLLPDSMSTNSGDERNLRHLHCRHGEFHVHELRLWNLHGLPQGQLVRELQLRHLRSFLHCLDQNTKSCITTGVSTTLPENCICGTSKQLSVLSGQIHMSLKHDGHANLVEELHLFSALSGPMHPS